MLPQLPDTLLCLWVSDLNANASAGPSFSALYLQDVQSNKTCSINNRNNSDGSNDSSSSSSTATRELSQAKLNCTCLGRRGDVETGCYEVTGPGLSRVLGGEAALWGEAVNADNLHAATFMAASVVAERLWSPRETVDVSTARTRLVALQEVMAARGFTESGMPP